MRESPEHLCLSDLLFHQNYRAILQATTASEIAEMRQAARLYEDAVDLLIPPMHSRTEVAAARRTLRRISPQFVMREEDVGAKAVFMSCVCRCNQTLCEAYIDSETTFEAITGCIPVLVCRDCSARTFKT